MEDEARVLANKLEIKTANMEIIRNGKLALSQSIRYD